MKLFLLILKMSAYQEGMLYRGIFNDMKLLTIERAKWLEELKKNPEIVEQAYRKDVVIEEDLAIKTFDLQTETVDTVFLLTKVGEMFGQIDKEPIQLFETEQEALQYEESEEETLDGFEYFFIEKMEINKIILNGTTNNF